MSKIIIANFKANGNKEFFNDWLSGFNNESQNQILLSPPSVYLDFFSEKKINFELCSQNVCEYEEGQFTSQHTASMLLDLGVKNCIIGHSESRSLLKEEDCQIFEKFEKLNNKKIRPIVCIGEPLEIRESNKVRDYIKNQTEKFHNFEGEIIFGYEPLWAIGTGRVPKLDGPNGPNKESELPPPKADPRSEPLPCCIKTDATISTPKITKIIFINMTALS